MDDLRLPDPRPLPRHAMRRRHLVVELERRASSPARHLPHAVRWLMAAAGIAVAGAVAALTLAGRGDERPDITPAGAIEPGPDQILHLTTTITTDGAPVLESESWSVAGPPRLERVIMDSYDPEAGATQFQIDGNTVTWTVEGREWVVRRVVPGTDGASVEGSSASWRRLNAIATSPNATDEGEAVVDGIVARRVKPAGADRPGLEHSYIVDTAQRRIAIDELVRIDEQGRRNVVRTTLRAELIPATDQLRTELTIHGADPVAPVDTSSPVSATVNNASGLIRDLSIEPVATDPVEIARSMPRGSAIFVGTAPSCVAVQAKVEYLCTLTRPPDPPFVRDYTGTVMGIVNRSLRVSGGCRGVDKAGLRWRCYLGLAAAAKGIVEPVVLGSIQTGPGSG